MGVWSYAVDHDGTVAPLSAAQRWALANATRTRADGACANCALVVDLLFGGGKRPARLLGMNVHRYATGRAASHAPVDIAFRLAQALRTRGIDADLTLATAIRVAHQVRAQTPASSPLAAAA